MNKRELKNRIKIHRAMHDWTQEELARRVDVTRKTINTIENGRFIPSAYLAIRIARVFGTIVEDIFQLYEE
jgi:putative transcriptional regulator